MIVHKVKIGEQKPGYIVGRNHKKIYVGCAESDTQYRDILVYGRHRWELYSKPTIEFLTADRQEMDLRQYKPMVEQVIREADGVMMIVSRQTSTDPLALW